MPTSPLRRDLPEAGDTSGDPGVGDRSVGENRPSPGRGAVRLIKRYANRKLYDTGIGELTSLPRIEGLVRAGVDVRVVDHANGEDVTAEVLVAILGNSLGTYRSDDEIAALLSFVRAPRDVLVAVADDAALADQLRTMRQRIRLLSAALDALLEEEEEPAGEPDGRP